MSAPFPVPDFSMPTSMTLHLPLPATGEVFCAEAVRVLPGRRSVWRAEYEGRPVYIKLFYGEGGYREWCREREGARLLLDAGVRTPSLIKELQWDDTHCALIYEAIQDGQSPRQRLDEPTCNRDQVIRSTLSALAQCHKANLVQSDMHLRNFLIAGDAVYVLDAADVQLAHGASRDRQIHDNLVAFLSLLSPEDDHRVPALIEYYFQQSQALDRKSIDTLVDEVQGERSRRQRRYLRKLYRESSQHCVQKSWWRFAIWQRGFDSAIDLDLIRNPDRVFHPQAEWLKRGNSSSVVRITLPPALVVKRYNIKSLAHALSRALRPTRASCSWRAAHHLLTIGVATPQPIALIENRFGPIRRTAWFISEAADGPNSRDYLRDDRTSEGQRSAHLADLLQLCLRLYRARLSHGDMKLSNVIVNKGRLLLIDLDAVVWHRSAGALERAFRRDMHRLLQNFDDQPQWKRKLCDLAADTELASFFPKNPTDCEN